MISDQCPETRENHVWLHGGEDEVTDADLEAVMEAGDDSDRSGFYWRKTEQDV